MVLLMGPGYENKWGVALLPGITVALAVTLTLGLKLHLQIVFKMLL